MVLVAYAMSFCELCLALLLDGTSGGDRQKGDKMF
jgi:hypothetical protein